VSTDIDRRDTVNPHVDPRRIVPPLHELLESPVVRPWLERWGRDPVKRALRAAGDEIRAGLVRAGEDASESDIRDRLLANANQALVSGAAPSLRRVLNATGVIVHTNLGRAPLCDAAAAGLRDVATGYSNLEYDVEAGERGSRYDHCARLLAEVTGSEAAMVVNNNAAAVALMVNELARDRDVVVSRGELVEIGGSFRIPDIVERSGGRLRSVGTTNRTRLDDYRRAVGPDTGVILKVHPSNYRLEGFVQDVSLADLGALGRERGVPVAHDLGSAVPNAGELVGADAAANDLERSVRAGIDLIMWSGDKLLGGPQSGIVHGSAEAIGRLRANPLARAFRVDKLTLAALEATLLAYRDPDAARSTIPVLRMINEPTDSVRTRVMAALTGGSELVRSAAEARRMKSVVGGGSLPGSELESWGVAVIDPDPERVDLACRAGTPPLIGRIEKGEFLLDFRTLAPGEESTALTTLGAALASIE
jgi:L-seryl-tRNA(Ser) seleniumtransferase